MALRSGSIIFLFQALHDAVRDKKLCGVIHPYIADAIISKLNNRPIGIFDLEGKCLSVLAVLRRLYAI